MQILFHQYELIKDRRETLFQYCETLAPEDFTFDHENFGGRSIRYLFVHVANVYTFWMGHFPKMDERAFAKPEDYISVDQIRKLYKEVDLIVERFLTQFDLAPKETVKGKILSKNLEVAFAPLQLFTHGITHEYHHKGQMLSMSRQLGYIPVDTDIIRFE